MPVQPAWKWHLCNLALKPKETRRPKKTRHSMPQTPLGGRANLWGVFRPQLAKIHVWSTSPHARQPWTQVWTKAIAPRRAPEACQSNPGSGLPACHPYRSTAQTATPEKRLSVTGKTNAFPHCPEQEFAEPLLLALLFLFSASAPH